MAIKELQTRIALKYDSYENWTKEQPADSIVGKNLVLLPGEIGICEIPAANNDSNVAPTVLFKVGNGTKKFHELPWASAKAADVYGWAKASDVTLEGKTIKFVGTDKTIVLNYVTEDEVKAITDPIAADVANLKAALGTTDNVTTALADLDERLDVIEGADTVEGSVAKALKDAKAYTDEREEAIKEAIEGTAADTKDSATIAGVKKYADVLNTAMDGRVDTLEAASIDYNTRIGDNATAIENITKTDGAIDTAITGVTQAYEAADTDINNKIGTGFDAINTVAKAIQAAQDAADTAQADVDALTAKGGAVTVNTANIATNASEIARVEGLVTTEKTRAEGVEEDFAERIGRMEAFFGTADKDGNDTSPDKTVYDALDTLKEIQDYIISNGSAAADMLDAIDANAQAIEDLKDIVENGGTLEVRVDQAESDISDVKGRADALEAIVDGYGATGDDYATVKAHVDAVSVRAEKGITDAATAQAAAEGADAKAQTAQDEVDALEIVVAGVKSTADTAASDLANLTTRVTTAEGDIDALEAIVKTGDDTNAKLREAITELQGIVKTGADANATLGGEIDALANKVNDETTGLAATKAIADEAKSDAEDAQSRVAAIEADYVRIGTDNKLYGGKSGTDVIIFDCGSALTVI